MYIAYDYDYDSMFDEVKDLESRGLSAAIAWAIAESDGDDGEDEN